MPEMSDLYMNICLKVSGKNLDARKTNPVIDYHTSLLEELKIVEEREDGKFFKAWVIDVSEFNHEIISKDVLLCSRRIKFEVRDPYPHHSDNRQEYIYAKIHKALMDLRIHHDPNSREEILIETHAVHVDGNSRFGKRWPKDKFAGAFK